MLAVWVHFPTLCRPSVRLSCFSWPFLSLKKQFFWSAQSVDVTCSAKTKQIPTRLVISIVTRWQVYGNTSCSFEIFILFWGQNERNALFIFHWPFMQPLSVKPMSQHWLTPLRKHFYLLLVYSQIHNIRVDNIFNNLGNKCWMCVCRNV